MMQKWADYRSILQEKGQQAKDQVKTVKLIGNMIWKSGPFLILALFLFMFFEGILPAFQLYASKQIIDGLSAVDGGGFRSAKPPLGLVVCRQHGCLRHSLLPEKVGSENIVGAIHAVDQLAAVTGVGKRSGHEVF
ncbi:hypothetical protein [Brevibacillus gelatini]